MLQLMPPKPATNRPDDHFARAEDFANYSLRMGGQLPPVVFAATEKGEIWFCLPVTTFKAK
jgi:hypothetical protein